MDEDANSWIRRVKYSHTICHRLDSSRLQPFSSTRQTNSDSGLKSRPKTTIDFPTSISHNSQILRNPSTSRHRCKSPVLETSLSEAFKEAQSDRKRFSTPLRDENLHENSNESHYSKLSSSVRSDNKFSSMRSPGKSMNRKDSAWTKYFDHGVGRIMAVEMEDELTVDTSKLRIGNWFASGGNSRLYRAEYKDIPVALKIIRQPDDDENGKMASRLEKQYNREVRLLSQLHHQNIIKLVAASRNPPVFCVITEFLDGGSLRSFMHKLESRGLPLDKVVKIATDIARGMEYIHSQGVVHRDLKPENLIFDHEGHVKIVDFGIACKEAYCDALADDPGTYRWMAPEMIKRKSHGRKVDVYSFGLVLSEMVSGVVPFRDKTPIQAAFAVVNKKLRPVIPADCPLALRVLIEHCWANHPEKRPEFSQILQVLEQFKSSLAHDGTLNLVQTTCLDDHKKGLLHWIHKFIHAHHEGLPSIKPKFT